MLSLCRKHLAESPINQTQVLREQDDGRIELVAEVEDTAQLRWWILAFGKQIEVTAPEKLRKNIYQTLQEEAEKYEFSNCRNFQKKRISN